MRRLSIPQGPLWLVLAAASLFLRSGFPVDAVGWATLDDFHFVRQANSIGAGHWLGAYNIATLAKGPFYPVFILASFAAGIPLKLAEQLVFLGASAIAARVAGWGWRGTLLFAALAFIPVFWNPSLSRVIREGLYVGLSLGVVAGAVAVAARPRLWTGGALGLVLGAFWLTREEGIWLVPALLVALAWGLARSGRRLVPALVCAALLASASVGAVALLNWRVYGVAETVDVHGGPFVRAYGALSRIETEGWRRYVVFPAEARARAYRVSEAARALQPFLEGEPGAGWRRTGCTSLPGMPCEFLAPWFQWALRDAAARAGAYKDARSSNAFFDRMASEIDGACGRGDIPCGPPRATLAPPFRWDDLRSTLPTAVAGLRLVSAAGGDAVARPANEATEPARSEFADIVGPVALAPLLVLEWTGTITVASGRPALSIVGGPGVGSFRSDVALQPPNERDEVGGGGTTTRVTLATDCPVDRCELAVDVDGRAPIRERLDRLPVGPAELGGVTLDLSPPRPVVLHRDSDLRGRAILAVARAIGLVYTVLLPPLALAGFVLLFVRRDFASPTFVLAVASAVAVLSRVVLLAYLDVTAIPSINLLYLSPAAPFLVVLAVTGLTRSRA